MLSSLTLDDPQNNVNWRVARKADDDTSVYLQVPSLPHELLLDIMNKLLSAKRKPEPAAKVVQHLTFLRSVSRTWSIFFAKMPVDLLFSGPTTPAQLEWLAAKTSPPVRSVSLKVAPQEWEPREILDAILQHCGNSLESLEGVVLTNHVIEHFERLTQLPKLRMLRLLCYESQLRRSSLNISAWHDKFYARIKHDSEMLGMVWLTLRCWPCMGTGARLLATRVHEDAVGKMQYFPENEDNSNRDFEDISDRDRHKYDFAYFYDYDDDDDYYNCDCDE